MKREKEFQQDLKRTKKLILRKIKEHQRQKGRTPLMLIWSPPLDNPLCGFYMMLLIDEAEKELNTGVNHAIF